MKKAKFYDLSQPFGAQPPLALAVMTDVSITGSLSERDRFPGGVE